MLERIVTNPQADTDKMAQVVALQERIFDRQAEVAYSEALAAMQGEMPAIKERGKAMVKGQVRFKYALWEDINEQIKPILHRHGFSIAFKTEVQGDKMAVTGVLRHRGGHHEETSILVPADVSGSKNAVQAIGSGVSYGKRYCAGALLNLTSYGEDDDGFAAGGEPLTAGQVEVLEKLIEMSGANEGDYLTWIGAESLDEIPQSKYVQAEAALRRKAHVAIHRPAKEAAAREEVSLRPAVPPGAVEGEPEPGPEGEPPQKITARDHKRLEAKIKEKGQDREKIKATMESRYGVAHFPDLAPAQLAEVEMYLDGLPAVTSKEEPNE
jgi:hypothetical protein